MRDAALAPGAVGLSVADRDQARERAELVYAALWEHFFVEDDHLFREAVPFADGDGNPYSYVWPLSQTLAASNQMALLPDADPFHLDHPLFLTRSMDRYLDLNLETPAYAAYFPPPHGNEHDHFFDDNAWIGLEMLRVYDLTGNEIAFERASQIFDFIVSGWDSDASRPSPGGVFWVDSMWNMHRNTVSNAPSAKLGLLLAEREHNPDRRQYYLDWSKQMYDWVDASLREEGGLYWDHLDVDGTIDETIYTYNQGTMLGATLLLYGATGDERYLERAEEISLAVIDRWDSDGLLAQPIAFNAILFHNLLIMNDQRPNPAYLNLMLTYADQIWLSHRDPDTGLVTTSSPTQLLDQSGAARIYAMLAGYGT